MTFRYIGSKARLIDQISTYMGPPQQDAFFVDAFCGTGVVAEAAAGLGWNVRINDSLHSAVISAGARLTGSKQATFKKLGGYGLSFVRYCLVLQTPKVAALMTTEPSMRDRACDTDMVPH